MKICTPIIGRCDLISEEALFCTRSKTINSAVGRILDRSRPPPEKKNKKFGGRFVLNSEQNKLGCWANIRSIPNSSHTHTHTQGLVSDQLQLGVSRILATAKPVDYTHGRLHPRSIILMPITPTSITLPVNYSHADYTHVEYTPGELFSCRLHTRRIHPR
jgi:hypothetical protein